MAAKEVRFAVDARDRMLRGVEILADAVKITLDVKVGDHILFGKWSGTEVKIDGEDLIIMKESDILGLVDAKSATAKAA